MPHSYDLEYAQRAIPQYERAVTLAGGEPVRIQLDQTEAEIKEEIKRCDAVLLPGSKADVDPARFHAAPSPHTAKPDPQRDAVDDLLLADAYQHSKPILGICYGLQSLNVYRAGSLIQHIPDFLPEATRAKVNHEAGKGIAVAHTVEIAVDSKLAKILCGDSRPRLSGRAELDGEAPLELENQEEHGFSRANSSASENRALSPEGASVLIPVNSSHHQSADAIGKGLRIVARCAEDGIIEALEGTTPDHFVLAVQWHPERSMDHDAPSRAIFRALIDAARNHRAE